MTIGKEEKEDIRRAYYEEGKSQREIAKERGRCRKMVKEVVEGEEKGKEQREGKSLVYEPYRQRVEALLEENEQLPKKQRYTAAKIYELISDQGYEGCESRIRQEIGKWKKREEPVDVYVPLSFEPGLDAQCDWVRRVGADEIPV